MLSKRAKVHGLSGRLARHYMAVLTAPRRGHLHESRMTLCRGNTRNRLRGAFSYRWLSFACACSKRRATTYLGARVPIRPVSLFTI
jgi:hypothetical protein